VRNALHLSPYGGGMEAMARQNWTDDRIEERFDRVEGQISDLRIEMRTEIKDLRGEIKDQGDELRGEIKDQGDELRMQIKGQGDELRTEIKEQGKELRAEIAAGDAGLRREIVGVEARLRTQMSEHQAATHEHFGRLHDDLIALHRMIARIGWSVGLTMLTVFVGFLIAHF